MESIRSEPEFLNISDKTVTHCPCCSLILTKEVRKGSYLNQCSYCNYGDRPFASASSLSWQNHYPNGCECERGEKDYLFITCDACKNPKCADCNKSVSPGYKYVPKKLCEDCEKRKKKREFNDIWKTSTTQDKLMLHGIAKLKILAKNKKLKGYSKYSKDELIGILKLVVEDTDFPIKPTA